jgi:hypothetical protein
MSYFYDEFSFSDSKCKYVKGVMLPTDFAEEPKSFCCAVAILGAIGSIKKIAQL